MARIDNTVINDIRNKANIVDIVGSYIPLTKKGQDYLAVCPFHDDHSPSMHVSPNKQIYKCFSCNAAGNVFTFVQNYEDVSFVEAIKIVADKIGYQLLGGIQNYSNNKFNKEKEIMDIACKFYQNNLDTSLGLEAKKYLVARGITEDIIKKFQIGLSLDNKDVLSKLLVKKGYDNKTLVDIGLIYNSDNKEQDFFNRRIMFPLWDKDGNVVGFSGRIYRNEDLPKYVNSKESYLYKKGQTLYNYHNAKKYVRLSDSVIVVEGFMDAIRLVCSGIENVVALQGTAMTKEQIGLIKKLRCKVLLCLDNDEAGIKATIVNGELLKQENIDVNVIKLSEAKDPDEYILKFGIEAFKNVLNNPVAFLEFKLNSIKNGKNLNNNNDLAIYINEVLEALVKENDTILIDVTLKDLANKYNVDLSILRNKLNELRGVDDVRKELFLEKKVEKGIKKTSYDIACEKIIYYMLVDPKYIKEYQKRIGYFVNNLYRNIANYIVYYNDEVGKIEIADFISFLFDKKEEYDKILEITNQFNEKISDENFINYVRIINKKMDEDEIRRLKVKLKEELDVNKKIEIAAKITEIKKRSV